MSSNRNLFVNSLEFSSRIKCIRVKHSPLVLRVVFDRRNKKPRGFSASAIDVLMLENIFIMLRMFSFNTKGEAFASACWVVVQNSGCSSGVRFNRWRH